MGAVLVGKETTHGTVAGSFISAPVNFSAQLKHGAKSLEEQRNSQDVHFSHITGRKHEEWAIAPSPVYHDIIGYYLMSAVGLGTQTVVQASTVYDQVHKFEADPKSLSQKWAQRLNNVQAYQSLNCVVDALDFEWDAEGDSLTFSANGFGMPETEVTAPTYSFSTVKPIPAWVGAVTLDGGAYSVLRSGKISIKRNRKPYPTINNTQSPDRMAIGSRVVEYELVVAFDSKGLYDDFKNGNTDALTVVFADTGTTIGTSSNPTLTCKLGTVNIEDATINDEPEVHELTLKGRALYNVTDASTGVFTVRSTRDYNA